MVYGYGFLFHLHGGGSDIRLKNDHNIKLLSVDWCLGLYLAGPTMAQLEFSIALTIYESFHHSVLI